MDSLKSQLLKILLQNTENQINLIRKAIAEIQQSANEETKSSAGDKYETGRAMAQLEIDKLRNQLLQSENALQTLTSIQTANPSDKVGFGSLIKTNQGCFFISVPAKEVKIESQIIYPISVSAPIAKCLMGKRKGESYSIQGKEFIIEEIA